MSVRNEFKMHLYSIINAYSSRTHLQPILIAQERLHFGFELRQNTFTVCFSNNPFDNTGPSIRVFSDYVKGLFGLTWEEMAFETPIDTEYLNDKETYTKVFL